MFGRNTRLLALLTVVLFSFGPAADGAKTGSEPSRVTVHADQVINRQFAIMDFAVQISFDGFVCALSDEQRDS